MNKINDLIPDADVLLALQPEELAPALLELARRSMQNGIFHSQSLTAEYQGYGIPAIRSNAYPREKEPEVSLAIGEAWQWLLLNILIMPAEGMNGSNGYVRLTRRGLRLVDNGDFKVFSQAAGFPKKLLHPSISDKVWVDLARGDYADAVFFAFRTVEEAVRAADGKYKSTDIGISLMRDAFNPTKGPLTDLSQPEAEREALMHLFAGSIGSYKNPHSHRTVSLFDPAEAQEMVMLASHLLRIVEDRVQRKKTLGKR